MKNQNKILSMFFVILGLGLLAAPSYGQEAGSPNVDENEIRQRDQEVTFQNRNNLLAPDYVRSNQTERGKRFAEQILQSKFASSQGITIKRIVDTQNPGLGADVLILDKDTDFGHINGIKRIISGYLMESFEYKERDAQMLSNIIVYYNANIRKNIDTVKSRYSKAVVENLNPDTVGIDRYFRNWAGQTEILIPLQNNLVRPGNKDMDTSELQENTKADLDKKTEKTLQKTIDKRRTEDKGRLKEKARDIQKENKDLDREKARAEAEAKRLADEQKRSQEREQKATDKQQQVEQDLNAEKAKPESEQDKEKIEQLEQQKEEATKDVQEEQQKQSSLEQKQKELAAKTEKIEEKKEENQETLKQVKQQEEDIKAQERGELTSAKKDKKIEQLAEENQQLKEEKEKEEQTTPNVIGEKILFMRVMRNFPNGHYSNQLWMIDPINDQSLFRSGYDKICGKDFLAIEGEGIVVIGFEGSAEEQAEHMFVLLDQANLQPKKTGENVIHWLTPLIYKENKIYAFEIYQGKVYLSTFNNDLSLDKRSSEPISPFSEVSFYFDKIYLTTGAKSGNNPEIMVLKKDTLETIKIIKPIEKTTP